TLAQAAELAAAHGGAAKPSGAGGGDIAVAVFDAREKGAADAYQEACRQAGMAPVVVPLHAVRLPPEPFEGTTPCPATRDSPFSPGCRSRRPAASPRKRSTSTTRS